MKIHYINILLFAFTLNTSEHNQRNHNSTTYHTTISKRTKTHRSLCECDLYMPNYENDPQMKKVIQQFYDRTTQRFHEYDDRMKTTRQKCKDKCDKEIQKIILKDKLEKELMDKFATLQTDIQKDGIPTCICEKSIAEKTEKGCLRCGYGLGSVAPMIGLTGSVAVNVWKTAELAAAKAAAAKAAGDAATEAGMKAVVSKINVWSNGFTAYKGFVNLAPIVKKSNFNCPAALRKSAMALANKSCDFEGRGINSSFCNTLYYGEETTFEPFAQAGIAKYKTEFASQKALLEAAELDAVDATYTSFQTSIIAPIITIVVIVLIMVIIYLILRYRRKKKMKKKLQYIKLLEE
ncbi:hypothetical protein PFTANZ_05856 [Plasmodium falciparum Tanzania (2000708)]|uniref:Surface antigen n=1 Tax=Plasmodium falciparum Tanzania (2000708) TaxID=1036725 RepID=A0A024VZX1_PLAFA|nr:hypothetical protein PFTANZ_05856 [Plasmodium falciparum Tanzania (2000708)]